MEEHAWHQIIANANLGSKGQIAKEVTELIRNGIVIFRTFHI